MTEKPVTRWLILNFSLLFLPMLIIVAGIYYIVSLQQNERIRNFEIEAAEMLESLRYYSGTEKYICSTLAGIFSENREPEKLKDAVARFTADHALDLQYYINNADGSIFYSNFPVERLPGDVSWAFKSMNILKNDGYAGGERKIPKDVYANLRSVYGQHFFPRYYNRCFSGKNLTLRRTSAAADKPMLWLNVSETTGLSVFVPPEAIDSFCGVRYHARQHREKLIAGFIRNGNVDCYDPLLSTAVSNQAEMLQNSLSSIVKLSDYYVLLNYIDSTMMVFCGIKREDIERVSFTYTTLVMILTLFIGMAIFAGMSYLVVVRGKVLSLRLKLQLLVLFVSSNAMAGFVLYTIGSDYLQQFRSGLINDAYYDGMAYLQSIDELYSNELTVQKERLDRHLLDFKRSLKKKGPSKRSVLRFIKSQNPRPHGFFLVASSTGIVAGDRGILKDEKVYEKFTSKFHEDKLRINTMKAMSKIGNFVLASLNKQTITSKAGTEAELITETVAQQSPADLIRKFADQGSFSEWGVGERIHPTFVSLMKLFDKVMYDYMLLYLWDSDDLEISFIERVFLNLGRNELGLQVMIVDEKFVRGYPVDILTNPRLRNFALKLRDRSITRPELCDYKGSEFLMLGHKCVAMKNIRLLGLFPIEKIAVQVGEKTWLLALLALVSFLISISISLFISGSILRPLGELQTGVTALNERNFSWRVPDLGGDEFGHLAAIFNETLIDLEELHVASQVQEKLLTQMQGPSSVGCLSFLCVLGASSAYGGDYFDLIDIDASERSIIFGRVTEPGVAGSLVLAFVKSATMQLQSRYPRPDLLAAELNALLAGSSESGGNKTMQLQNLLLHSDGKIEFAGAGVPTMLLFDSVSGKIASIEYDSAELGKTTGRSFKLTQVQLEPGQVFIMTTAIFKNSDCLSTELCRCQNPSLDQICRVFAGCCAAGGNEVPPVLVIAHEKAPAV
ncbi:MAG: HAMP domain-containing protein [Candidatus Riflebacteria bacterium]|nr:HAMP domain-containing protein [Candidatus Riflebacteria bacterium]